ncbi:hypothetical protein ACFWY6_35300 [Streptomyces sp. NPDC059037]|uniref:hypothetical protein n=1 Tax=Streptomyces sp. NPDC059037 TaxID=3346710 RepID=UPI003679AB21
MSRCELLVRPRELPSSTPVLRWRWWTPRELAETADPLWPPQLPALPGNLSDASSAGRLPVHLGFVARQQGVRQG